MSLSLKLHPDSRCLAVSGIAVETRRPQLDAFELRYVITGDMRGIRFPPMALPMRAEELWKTTCLEAFVRTRAGDAYYEFNFAPSTEWAVYQFGGYREGMNAAYEVGLPTMDVIAAPDRFELRVALSVPHWPTQPWRLGLSAVIEETNGAKSYWALAHPPGKPDFHHADGFAADLLTADGV
jgi:hypothetical protein